MQKIMYFTARRVQTIRRLNKWKRKQIGKIERMKENKLMKANDDRS